MKFSFFWLCLLMLIPHGICLSQEVENDEIPFYKRQVELRHDNDFLLFTDRFYTTGSFINYRVLLNETEGIKDRRQLGFTLSQVYYTPTNIFLTDIADFERPFAGYTAIRSGLVFTNHRRIIDLALSIGASGEISGAQGFQSWFHSTNESSNPSWEGQIANAAHGNIYGQYTREWTLLPNPFSVRMALSPGAAFGTKDIYLEQRGSFYFGNRGPITNTMAYHQLGAIEKEFFFALNFTYRYVFFDGLLEGNLIGDSSEFVLEPVEHLFLYGIDVFYRSNRMEYMFGYNYVSRKAPTTELHAWITLSIARNFN